MDHANLLRIAVDRRMYNAPRDLHLKMALENKNIILQLIGPHGSEDQISCTSPDQFWRPS
jgi:hypothetical protein